MTWWTEDGHIVPPKPVIDLLVEAAAGLRDEITDEIELNDPGLRPDTGVPVFDGLDPKTRIFAIAHVLKHLLDPEVPSPDLYAWNEGTLWALFKRVENQIAFEIDMEPSSEPDIPLYLLRRLVLDAVASYGHPVERDSPRSRNIGLWSDHLESIYTHLFWDLDCLEDDQFADMDPRRADSLKHELGIDPDYYATPPPLVRDEDYSEADAYIRRVGGYGRHRPSGDG
jgi:hypothetical protein